MDSVLLGIRDELVKLGYSCIVRDEYIAVVKWLDVGSVWQIYRYNDKIMIIYNSKYVSVRHASFDLEDPQCLAYIAKFVGKPGIWILGYLSAVWLQFGFYLLEMGGKWLKSNQK